MNAIGLTITEYLNSEPHGHGYSSSGASLEEIFAFPEYAIYLMLAVRIILLILGDPRKWRFFSFKGDSCSWDGFRRVCTCS